MIETEIKLPLRQPENIKTKLLALGFEEIRSVIERDIYFDNAACEIRTGGRALRIRETEDWTGHNLQTQINLKGEKLDTVSMTRTESETTIGSGEIGREILQGLGYQPVQPRVVKHRTFLCRDRITACLDRVEGLGDFLELEIMAEEKDRHAALDKIEHLLKELGYSMQDTVTVSYLSALQGRMDE